MVHVEVPIKVPEYQTSEGATTTNIPIEFMICKKKELKNVFHQFPYMKNFVGQVITKNLKAPTSENSLIVLAESEEAANHIIDSQVGDVLSKMGESNIVDIHITD